jgi:hypothetical protein
MMASTERYQVLGAVGCEAPGDRGDRDGAKNGCGKVAVRWGGVYCVYRVYRPVAES